MQVDGLPCQCGQRGCWETIATHRWLRDQAVQLNLPSAHTMTVGPLARLAATGHPGAGELFDRYVDYATLEAQSAFFGPRSSSDRPQQAALTAAETSSRVSTKPGAVHSLT
ncbi:hypothetical protein GCM10023194_77380 [Planotetraspora phitsanulokensis]|uniref:ROK family protein n=1 Tax=Planotetraspora phitsanulokensis TaxID=575192 RepID=A0A8J3U0B2_9ACTN|nr:hypothetical protein Pph01_05550 [Planotetraspora phitsanulokensis]